MPFMFLVTNSLNNNPKGDDKIIVAIILGMSLLGLLWLIYG